MNKIEELKAVIGQETPENFSPTLRAKLLAIDETRGGGVCIMEVVKSPYPEWSWAAQWNHKVGQRYERPVYAIHNAFFF